LRESEQGMRKRLLASDGFESISARKLGIVGQRRRVEVGAAISVLANERKRRQSHQGLPAHRLSVWREEPAQDELSKVEADG